MHKPQGTDQAPQALPGDLPRSVVGHLGSGADGALETVHAAGSGVPDATESHPGGSGFAVEVWQLLINGITAKIAELDLSPETFLIVDYGKTAMQFMGKMVMTYCLMVRHVPTMTEAWCQIDEMVMMHLRSKEEGRLCVDMEVKRMIESIKEFLKEQR